MIKTVSVLDLLCAFLGALVLGAMPIAAAPLPVGGHTKPGHVFIIVLENEGFEITFGARSRAPYLKDLAKQGALLPNYFGIGHYSLPNYLAMISGQAPNPATQADCHDFTNFVSSGTTPDGQAIGLGCVYPASTQTIANQLEAKGLTWKGYMEDMGNDPNRESATCGHPAPGSHDRAGRAQKGDQYATRHDPFVYFHAIIDSPTCNRRVVNLNQLPADLNAEGTTPNYVFITPNLCNDGHDGGAEENGENSTCVDGEPGGLVSADRFLKQWVPRIRASPAFQKDGLLVITFDESDIEIDYNTRTGVPKTQGGDASACCDEPAGPNIPQGQHMASGAADLGPGISGPGGGRIGAVLVSPFIAPGTVSENSYNHYSLLRSIEDVFGLDHLGYAGALGLKGFGTDVFTSKKTDRK